MSQREHARSQDEEILGLRMVKERLLTESQLNTAIDFQKAVGGRLVDVLVRLGLVDRAKLDAFLARTGQSVPQAGPQPAQQRSQPAPGLERTASLPAPAASTAEARKVSEVVETTIVLEALIRLLVRKGVIGKTEIKNEVLQLDADSLVRGGVVEPQ